MHFMYVHVNTMAHSLEICIDLNTCLESLYAGIIIIKTFLLCMADISSEILDIVCQLKAMDSTKGGRLSGRQQKEDEDADQVSRTG